MAWILTHFVVQIDESQHNSEERVVGVYKDDITEEVKHTIINRSEFSETDEAKYSELINNLDTFCRAKLGI